MRESILSDMRTTLTQARTRSGLSREALAAKSGVSLATIYRLEAGAKPSYDTVEKLESALKLRRGTLVFGDQGLRASA